MILKISKKTSLAVLIAFFVLTLSCSTSNTEPLVSNPSQISEHIGMITLPLGGWGYTLIPMETGNSMNGSVSISGQGISIKIEDPNLEEVEDLGVLKKVENINVTATKSGNYRLYYEDIYPNSDEKVIEFNIIVWSE